jgi:hypothetical protein
VLRSPHGPKDWLTGSLTELAIADGDFERAARLLDAGVAQLRPLGDP